MSRYVSPGSFDLSTTKNFPYRIQHTIQWARDIFENELVSTPLEASKYFAEPHKYLERLFREEKNVIDSGTQQRPESLRQSLERIKELVEVQQKHTYKGCVEFARKLFQRIFHDNIAGLLHSFPLDKRTESGRLFWSERKRAPSPAEFEACNPLHLEFIQSTANILAHIFQITIETDLTVIAQMANSITFQRFRPLWSPFQNRPKHDSQTEGEDTDVKISRLEKQLSFKRLTQRTAWRPIEFERDDPTNYHIEQISSASNIRANSYRIDEIDKFEVKVITGKIIPRVVTCSATTAGLVGIGIVKQLLKCDVSKFKNSFANLALPSFVFSDPAPPKTTQDTQYDPIFMGPTKALPPKFTTWDKINLKGFATFAELIEYFRTTYNINVCMVSSGQYCLYNTDVPNLAGRLESSILEAYQAASKKPWPSYKRYMPLEVGGEELTTNIDVLTPIIRYEV